MRQYTTPSTTVQHILFFSCLMGSRPEPETGGGGNQGWAQAPRRELI